MLPVRFERPPSLQVRGLPVLNGLGRIGRQARERREQQIAAFLHAECAGTTFVLAVNGQELLRAEDDEPALQAGETALYACTCRGGGKAPRCTACSN